MKEPPKTKGPGAVRRIQGLRKSNFCRQSITASVESLDPLELTAAKVQGSICRVGVVSSDLTAEALERKLLLNGGRFAIANSEAVDQLSMISGDLYGNGKSCASMAPFLKAFRGNGQRGQRK